MEEHGWLINLEAALADDCNVNDIYSICAGKAIPEALRPDVWQVCLDVRHKSDQMSLFNEIFDLPFQNQLREDCQKIVNRIGNDDEDKVSVLSDLESILTFYCKNRNFQYETENCCWIELLLPLLSLKLNRSDTYNLFESLRDTYIPKGCIPKGNVFHVFRLLLLYHDPELCTMLDTKKISPDMYSVQWFQSLFASCCSLAVILSMWDFYFQHADPFLVFFLGLIILINGREQILSMKDEPKEDIIKFIANVPCALEQNDVVDFCSLAQYYALKTPTSFKTEYLKTLYGSKSGESQIQELRSISQALCLPVSVYELVENSSLELAVPESVRFFLVDCRPAEQYNAGHLSTAFHLDCNLMLQEPNAFATAVQGLLNAQRQAIEAKSHAGGEHLCFMGSGRVEEDQYTHMVVASFLQKNTQYVSLLTGGYMSIHEYFGDHMADCLEDHNSRMCLVCTKNVVKTKNGHLQIDEAQQHNKRQSQKPTSDIFSKFSAAMKSKSAEVKEKLLDIIVNPSVNLRETSTHQPILATSSNGARAPVHERHVSSTERNGKRYRNMAPVFSIDDENDDHYEDPEVRFSPENAGSKLPGDAKEYVTNITSYLRNPDIINAFKCEEVHINGEMYDSHLIITPTYLIVLRELGKGKAQIVVRRPLSSIVKITAKKRHRDLITFKYGCPNGDGLLITDMDRFLIPNASEATAIISKQIVSRYDNTKLT